MADPADYTQLDLQNLSPEQAAEFARQQQAALAAQQHHALLGLLGTNPELQKAGAEQYAQAGRERGRGQETAGNVLRMTLERISQERQLAALNQQIEYQRGQLGLQGQQLGLEGQRLNLEALRPFLGPLLESQGKLESINNLANFLHISGSKLAEIAKLPAEARVKAIQDAFGMAMAAKGGGVPQPPAPKKKAAPPAAAAPAPQTADKWDAYRKKYGAVATE